jgi:hypothetical protein
VKDNQEGKKMLFSLEKRILSRNNIREKKSLVPQIKVLLIQESNITLFRHLKALSPEVKVM